MDTSCDAYLHGTGTRCAQPQHPITEPHIDYRGHQADPVAEQAWAAEVNELRDRGWYATCLQAAEADNEEHERLCDDMQRHHTERELGGAA